MHDPKDLLHIGLLSAIEAIRKRLPEAIPILTGLPFGHQANKLTLPIGAQADLNCNLYGFELKAQW
jgi:muramoyltetrapeptide carboxypeptidase